MEKIGRYEIERELGRGAMAVVYLAHDPYIKRQVAVKVMPLQLTFNPQFRLRFQREAEVIAALEHSAIVPIYDFGEHEEQPFIVMRYMSGGSLLDRLEEGPISLDAITSIFKRLSLALDKAHRQGIVHRDLKPGNVLFDEKGKPYLSDFSMVKVANESSAYTGGAIIGTPAYMSPEQAKGEPDIDEGSDIYSLGAVLYEILTGKQPYESETSMGLVVKHITEPVPRIQDANPELAPRFQGIISRAMAKERDHRYASASEMAQDLAATLEIEATATPHNKSDSELRHPPVKPQPGFRRWIIGGLATLAVIVGLLASSGNLFPISTVATAVTNGPATSAAAIESSEFVKTIDLNVATELPSTPSTPPTSINLPSTFIDDQDVHMALVAAGQFEMGGVADVGLVECQRLAIEGGCPRGWFEDEEPIHTVTLSDYYIDKYEVTNAEYNACVRAEACALPSSDSSATHISYFANPQYEDYPIIYVSWHAAATYCTWRGGRLPTEAEWEKAARGTDERVYPWGISFDGSLFNFCELNCDRTWANRTEDDGQADTAPVGTYPQGASPYGIYDMAGNVTEWVADWYAVEYYSHSPEMNPVGPSDGEHRVHRGGSWREEGHFARTAKRSKFNPTDTFFTIGIRCARSASP